MAFMLHCGLQQQNFFDNDSDSSVVSGVNVPLTNGTAYVMMARIFCPGEPPSLRPC